MPFWRTQQRSQAGVEPGEDDPSRVRIEDAPAALARLVRKFPIAKKIKPVDIRRLVQEILRLHQRSATTAA